MRFKVKSLNAELYLMQMRLERPALRSVTRGLTINPQT